MSTVSKKKKDKLRNTSIVGAIHEYQTLIEALYNEIGKLNQDLNDVVKENKKLNLINQHQKQNLNQKISELQDLDQNLM